MGQLYPLACLCWNCFPRTSVFWIVTSFFSPISRGSCDAQTVHDLGISPLFLAADEDLPCRLLVVTGLFMKLKLSDPTLLLICCHASLQAQVLLCLDVRWVCWRALSAWGNNATPWRACPEQHLDHLIKKKKSSVSWKAVGGQGDSVLSRVTLFSIICDKGKEV